MKALVYTSVISVLLFGQAAPPIGSNYALYWTNPTQDTANAPEVVGTCEVAISAATVDLNAVGGVALKTVTGLAFDIGTRGYPLTTLVAGLPNGNYKIWVRVLDLAGNPSTWVAIDQGLDVTPPKPPSGVSCKKLGT